MKKLKYVKTFENFNILLNESVSDKIQSIADKNCNDEYFNYSNVMEEIKQVLKEYFKDYLVSDLPDSEGETSGVGEAYGIKIEKDDDLEQHVNLFVEYERDNYGKKENVIKIVLTCFSGEIELDKYDYQIMYWEKTGGESRGYDSFGYEDTTYQEEGVDCEINEENIKKAITEVEEFL
jgi:hypothetical protein